jgi:hypothetical protein
MASSSSGSKPSALRGSFPSTFQKQNPSVERVLLAIVMHIPTVEGVQLSGTSGTQAAHGKDWPGEDGPP